MHAYAMYIPHGVLLARTIRLWLAILSIVKRMFALDLSRTQTANEALQEHVPHPHNTVRTHLCACVLTVFSAGSCLFHLSVLLGRGIQDGADMLSSQTRRFQCHINWCMVLPVLDTRTCISTHADASAELASGLENSAVESKHHVVLHKTGPSRHVPVCPATALLAVAHQPELAADTVKKNTAKETLALSGSLSVHSTPSIRNTCLLSTTLKGTAVGQLMDMPCA